MHRGLQTGQLENPSISCHRVMLDDFHTVPAMMWGRPLHE